jgi:hypothetical protein
MWMEDLGGGEVGWRGKVQHVNSGEVRYFQDWSVMLTFIKKQLDGINSLQTFSAEAEVTSITKEEDTSR